MARQTSFYYSFLVLPPEQRRAIVAVWDFCRAVDDAVDEAPRSVEAGVALPAGRGRPVGCDELRAPSTAAAGERAGCRRAFSPFDLPLHSFEYCDRRRRGPRHHA